MQKKSKGSNIMSLSMDEDLQALLTKTAKENNISRSELVRNLVVKFVVPGKRTTVVVHDEDSIPVVLKVPVTLKGKPEELKTWLDSKVSALSTKIGTMPKHEPATKPIS